VRRDSGAFTAKAELSLRTPRRGRIQTVNRAGALRCCTRQKARLRPAVQKASAQMLDMSHRFFSLLEERDALWGTQNDNTDAQAVLLGTLNSCLER